MFRNSRLRINPRQVDESPERDEPDEEEVDLPLPSDEDSVCNEIQLEAFFEAASIIYDQIMREPLTIARLKRKVFSAIAAATGTGTVSRPRGAQRRSRNEGGNNTSEEETGSLLAQACASDYYELTRALLSLGADVEDRGSKDDVTPLMVAISEGYHKIVRLILSHGADVNAKSACGKSPLMYACCEGNEDIVRDLLRKGARIENINGSSPLVKAVSIGNFEILKILLEHGAEMRLDLKKQMQSALRLAYNKGNVLMIRILLNFGADQEERDETIVYLNNALMEASVGGQVGLARFLLDAGAEVNIRSRYGSLLEIALFRGHARLAELFIERGANLEEANSRGYVPLMEAAREGHLDIVNYLLEHGADVNAQTKRTHETALSLAAGAGYLDVVDALCNAGADIDLGATTPLMAATKEGQCHVVAYLLHRGADVTRQNETGITALFYACEKGFIDTVELLILMGAEPDHRSKGGHTPLMVACRNGYLDVIKYLLWKGADVNRQTARNDHTPLSLACAGGHIDAVGLLLSAGANLCHRLKDGRTMIIEASKGGYTSLIRGLLDYQACEIRFYQLQLSQGVPLRMSDQSSGEGQMQNFDLSLGNSQQQQAHFVGLPAPTSASEDIVELATISNPPSVGSGELVSKLSPPAGAQSSGPPLYPSQVTAATAISERPKAKARKQVRLLQGQGNTNQSSQPTPGAARTPVVVFTGGESIAPPPSGSCAGMIMSSNQITPAEFLTLQAAAANVAGLNQAAGLTCGSGSAEAAQQFVSSSALLPVQGPQSQIDNKDQKVFLETTGSYVHLNLTEGTFSEMFDFTQAFASAHISSDSCSAQQMLTPASTLNLMTESMTSGQLGTATAANTTATIVLTHEIGETDSETVINVDNLSGTNKMISNSTAAAIPIDSFPRTMTATGTLSGDVASGIPDNSYQLKTPRATSATFANELAPLTTTKVHTTNIINSSGSASACIQPLITGESVQGVQKESVNSQVSSSVLSSEQVEVSETQPLPKKLVTKRTFSQQQQQQCQHQQVAATGQNLSVASIQTLPSASTWTLPLASTQTLPSASTWTMPSASEMFSRARAMDIDAVIESTGETSLSIAAACGHHELVKFLIEKKAHIEHRDKKGYTPLISAAKEGHEKVVELLLKNGAKIEAQCDKTRDTALSLACTKGRYEVVKVLLKSGADKEHRNCSDYTPLALAASGGYVKVIKLLLAYGADINSRIGSRLGINPLMLAAMNGNTGAVKVLLNRGSDVNAQIVANKNTALLFACVQGRHKVVKLLVERKANLEHRSKNGLTPLMEAAYCGHVEVGEILIAKGAEVNATTATGTRDTALAIAAYKGHYRFVELLLKRGAIIDARNKKGCTPLWLACHCGYFDVVQVLFRHGANMDSQENRKISCLMAAFRRGHIKVCQWMVKKIKYFPSDQQMSKYTSGLRTRSDLLKRCLQCQVFIKKARRKQTIHANKNAVLLMVELEFEKTGEEIKRLAAQRRREKRKKKKMAKKKRLLEKDNHVDSDGDDTSRNGQKRPQNKGDKKTKGKGKKHRSKSPQPGPSQKPTSSKSVSTNNSVGTAPIPGSSQDTQSLQPPQPLTKTARKKLKKLLKSQNSNSENKIDDEHGNHDASEGVKNAGKNNVKSEGPLSGQDNVQIEKVEDGPGTSNKPNNKKQKKGQREPDGSDAKKTVEQGAQSPEAAIPQPNLKGAASHSVLKAATDKKMDGELETNAVPEPLMGISLSPSQLMKASSGGTVSSAVSSQDHELAHASIPTSSGNVTLSSSSSAKSGNNLVGSSGTGKFVSIFGEVEEDGDEGWKEVTRSCTSSRSKRVMVPSSLISRVIGRGGSSINAIREASGANIKVENQQTGQVQPSRTIHIKGTAEAIKMAQTLITAMMNGGDLKTLLPGPSKPAGRITNWAYVAQTPPSSVEQFPVVGAVTCDLQQQEGEEGNGSGSGNENNPTITATPPCNQHPNSSGEGSGGNTSNVNAPIDIVPPIQGSNGISSTVSFGGEEEVKEYPIAQQSSAISSPPPPPSNSMRSDSPPMKEPVVVSQAQQDSSKDNILFDETVVVNFAGELVPSTESQEQRGFEQDSNIWDIPQMTEGNTDFTPTPIGTQNIEGMTPTAGIIGQSGVPFTPSATPPSPQISMSPSSHTRTSTRVTSYGRGLQQQQQQQTIESAESREILQGLPESTNDLSSIFADMNLASVEASGISMSTLYIAGTSGLQESVNNSLSEAAGSALGLFQSPVSGGKMGQDGIDAMVEEFSKVTVDTSKVLEYESPSLLRQMQLFQQQSPPSSSSSVQYQSYAGDIILAADGPLSLEFAAAAGITAGLNGMINFDDFEINEPLPPISQSQQHSSNLRSGQLPFEQDAMGEEILFSNNRLNPTAPSLNLPISSLLSYFSSLGPFNQGNQRTMPGANNPPDSMEFNQEPSQNQFGDFSMHQQLQQYNVVAGGGLYPTGNREIANTNGGVSPPNQSNWNAFNYPAAEDAFLNFAEFPALTAPAGSVPVVDAIIPGSYQRPRIQNVCDRGQLPLPIGAERAWRRDALQIGLNEGGFTGAGAFGGEPDAGWETLTVSPLDCIDAVALPEPLPIAPYPGFQAGANHLPTGCGGFFPAVEERESPTPTSTSGSVGSDSLAVAKPAPSAWRKC